eukprot:g12677.t1
MDPGTPVPVGSSRSLGIGLNLAEGVGSGLVDPPVAVDPEGREFRFPFSGRDRGPGAGDRGTGSRGSGSGSMDHRSRSSGPWTGDSGSQIRGQWTVGQGKGIA